jgi:hypothetical protein
MDIIQLGDFHISNTGNRTLFSFVIPPLPCLIFGVVRVSNSSRASASASVILAIIEPPAIDCKIPCDKALHETH